MSVVRIPHRSSARATTEPRTRPPLSPVIQAVAVGGAFVLGIVIALSMPGVARGAEPDPAADTLPASQPVDARPDSYDGSHDGLVNVDAVRGVLANDPAGDLTAELWTEPVYGTVMLAPDGGFVYTRTERVEADRFAYLAVDASGAVSEPVTVTLRFANRAPTCVPTRTLPVELGAVVELDLGELCTDPDGDPLTYVYQSPDLPDGSIWDADALGHLRFLPPPDWMGTATLVFAADDGLDASMTSLLVIKVAR
jgi:hypothetical protein